MAQWQHRTDAVHWYMQELSSRVVAESGIPSDRHHLGKLTLQGFKDAPDFVLQIDGATDETETFGSVLKRSVQCATAFRNLGLKQGDVIVLMAPNHIHLTIPMYAAFYLGISVAGIDMTLRRNELRDTFKCIEPKMIFCQSERVSDIRSAVEELKFDTKIITFDKYDQCITFSDLLEKYGSDASVKDFKAADFDPTKTISLLIATSGTTGLPKSAAITHKNMAVSVPYMWLTYSKFPAPTRLTVVFSPIQWYSALFQFVFSPIIRHSRLQSSAPMTQEHAYYLINKYRVGPHLAKFHPTHAGNFTMFSFSVEHEMHHKHIKLSVACQGINPQSSPTFAMTSPNMLATFLKIGDRNKCDFTCFETILVGGSSVHTGLVDDIKTVSPNTNVLVVYGMSEISGLAFNFDATVPNSLGKPIQSLEHKLVDYATHKDITEANVPGELWVKGPGVFQGYYNNPEVTSQVISKGGWMKTGDIMYRDNMSYFYFVERIKLLLKYRNHQISPLEIETVIANHPGVFEVAVTGTPHPEHGDLPVACIVPHEGYKITAQEIKDLVRDSLSDSKQLRGGVLFLNELPLTSTSKIDRPKLAALARAMQRE